MVLRNDVEDAVVVALSSKYPRKPAEVDRSFRANFYGNPLSFIRIQQRINRGLTGITQGCYPSLIPVKSLFIPCYFRMNLESSTQTVQRKPLIMG
jgi:hypothetical protein